MKELNFKEVITNIKPGETWEGTERIVKSDWQGNISISLKKEPDMIVSTFEFVENWKYKLKRKEYTFTEAFKAYEEGKEIEGSSFRYKKDFGIDRYFLGVTDEWLTNNGGFDLKEIRGIWYINN